MRVLTAFLMVVVLATGAFGQFQANKASIAFGSVQASVAKVDSFFVKDTSASSATITAVTNVRTQYVVTAKSGNMTPTLAAGDSAWYYVTFTPDSVGSTPDTVFVTHAGGTIKIALSGTGTNPLLTRNSAGTSVTSLSWLTDTLRPGIAKLDSFQIRNNGLTAIEVSAFSNANSEFTFTPAPPFSVPETSTVVVYTSYIGTSPGRDLDTLVITHNSAVKNSSPLRLALAARTSASLRFTRGGVTIDDLDWMAVTAANDGVRNGVTTPAVAIDSARTILVSLLNNSGQTIRVDSIKFSSIHWENLVPLPYDHRSGAAYDRILRFNYRAKNVSSPEHIDTMYVFTNDPNGSPIKLTIKGRSARRVYAVNASNATSLSFGNVSYGTLSTLPLRILNKQDISLTVDSVALLTKDPRYSIAALTPATSVAAGAELSFDVTFTATDTASGPTFRDTVLVYVSGYQAQPLRVPLTGTVVTNIVFSPSATSITMGDLPVQAVRDTTIKIYNRTKNNYNIDGIALAVNVGYTIMTNTASQALNAGDSVVITVRFSPQTGGRFRDTLLVSHNIDSAMVPAKPYRIAFTGTGNTNAVPDPSNFITVDNAIGVEGFPASSPDSSYVEVGGWWNGGGFGGGNRRSPNLSGSANGTSARYTFAIDTSAAYLLYHYHVQSGNGGNNYYVHFRKFGVGGIVDSLRYNLLDHNATGFGGTFLPLAIHYYNGVGPSAATVTIGADERSSPSFLRVDAMRLVKSRLPADVEFGRRDINFGPVRVPEEFPQVTVGDNFPRPYRIYNLGTDTLKISSIDFYPTTTPVPWFYIQGYTAGQEIVIPPMTVSNGVESGGYHDLPLVFGAYQEGSARDSMVITSNDPLEPKAYIIMSSSGLNYNFILNASIGGTEPHFRAPAPPIVTTLPRYYELPSGSWLSSTASPMFPITGANLNSRVNTGGATTLPHESYFEFELPDVVYDVIPTFGDYIIEQSPPAGSSNGHQAAVMRVNHTFGIPQDTAIFNTLNQPAGWLQVGGSLKTFKMSPGGPITLTVARPGATDVSGAANLLRIDLVRVRKVPTGALAGVNVATGATVDFGNVNFRDPAGPTGDRNKQEIIIGSRGESQLVISSIRFRSGASFSVVNPPPAYPTYLRAINGELKLSLAFSPNRLRNGYVDTLEVVSNSVNADSLILVRVVGNGIGGIWTVDDGGLSVERGANPTFDGLYLGKWDANAMTNWQIEVNAQTDSIGIGNSRRMLAMKLNRTGYFEWYPMLPPPPPDMSDSMYVGVYATIPAGMSGVAPAAKYTVYPGAGAAPHDTVVSQVGRPRLNDRPIDEVFLGNYWFIRGARDAFLNPTQGAGLGIYGHVRVSADTAAANFAGSDTLALVADAVIIRELEPPPGTITGVAESEIPTEFALDQNYPNPFNPSTTIRFALPMRANVELKVYDLLGREVRTLVRGDQLAAGIHSVTWDGRNSVGNAVATGVYFYRINASGFTESRKMLLLK